MLASIGRLLVLQLPVALASWAVLAATTNPTLRLVLRGCLVVAYLIALFPWLSQQDILSMDIVFFWLHFGFLCRFLSSLYFYHCQGGVPTFGYHVLYMMWAPSQRYSAGSFREFRGRSFDLALLREWGRHLAHLLVVAVIAFGVIYTMLHWRSGDASLRMTMIYGASGILGLVVLTVCVDIQSMIWSLRGYHRSFFGQFPFTHSKHVGMFWTRWNTMGARFFQELTKMLGLRRRFFLNVMAVFVISGVLHQITVMYYTREFTGGTFLAFVLNGLAVWASARIYHQRRRIPKPLRIALFNPITTFLILCVINLPIAFDFNR